MKLPKWRMSVFETVSLAAILLILARMFFPALVFDSTSLILFAIAAVAFLLPRLLGLLPPLKKAKYGDFEVEFDEAIERLEERVVEAEAAPSQPAPKPLTAYPPMRASYVQGYK